MDLQAEVSAEQELAELYRFYVQSDVFSGGGPEAEFLLDFGIVLDDREERG